MYDPVIKDGKLARLSVSQLQRFEDCERKWWYKYVGGIDEPERGYFIEGKAGHLKLEEYYGTGEKADLDERVFKLIPKPSENTLAENELQLLELAGIPFQGAMDLVDGNDIYDYKFQSQIRKFPEPTAQAWGYLEELRRRHTGRGLVFRFHYVLISKKGAPPQKQTFEFTADEIEKKWQSYLPVVERMKVVAESKTEPQANSHSCYKYGPCPYLGICDRGAMSFLDELNDAKKDSAAVELPEVEAKSFRPPEVRAKDGQEPNLETFDPSDYERPQAKKEAKSKPARTRKIKTVEVRHSVTLDIKRDGIFSASIGLGFVADVEDGETVEDVRKQLSDMVLDAIKHEAEKYRKV